MIRALWVASSGMSGQEFNISVISNNLANVNTTGFKKSRAEFQDLLYQTIQRGHGPSAPSRVQVGHGVKVSGTQKVFTQGDLQPTENPLDLVIEGDGFFQILRPDGTIAYTRDGALKRNAEGLLVTSQGYVIEPEIYVDEDVSEIAIAPDGRVFVKRIGSTDVDEVGQIELAKFVNPAGLENIGGNLLQQTVASGDPILGEPGTMGLGTIAQGFLEMSNVKVVEEMVNMIVAQRAYEINSKAIQASDEMLQMANNLRR
jgi:flagellar basal-body rod protein FlgG